MAKSRFPATLKVDLVLRPHQSAGFIWVSQSNHSRITEFKFGNQQSWLAAVRKEAKVYLAALELAEASVQAIAKKSGVNRTTSYFVLESLVSKGLITTYDRGKKTFYTAENPNSLESLFELQRKEVEERQKNFRKLMPQLRLIYNKSEDKPIVRFFEGKQGLLSCVDEFLSGYKEAKELVRMTYSKDKLDEIFTEEDRKKYRSIRLKRKIKSKVLYTSKTKELKNTLDGLRIKVEEKDFPFAIDMAIYSDRVRISSLGKKLSAVLIQDKEIANTLKSIFDLAWEAAQARAKKK